MPENSQWDALDKTESGYSLSHKKLSFWEPVESNITCNTCNTDKCQPQKSVGVSTENKDLLALAVAQYSIWHKPVFFPVMEVYVRIVDWRNVVKKTQMWRYQRRLQEVEGRCKVSTLQN